MSPLGFHRHVAGYRRRQENELDRWRHMYALTNNVNATEKSQLIDPLTLLPLPRDTQARAKPQKVKTHKRISRAEFERLWRMANTTPPPPED